MKTFQILMVGPSRVGKTSTLASMSKDLQVAVNNLQYHTTIPDELREILRNFEKTQEKNDFKVDQQPIRIGTAANSPYEINLYPQGNNEERDIALKFIDVPGGWYSPPTQENPNPNYNEAKKLLSQSIVSFWCIDCVSMIENNSKYHEDRNAPEYITNFYKDNVSLPKGHRIVFVLMRAETYIRDKKRGVEWLMGKGGEFNKHYGKCINELKKTLNDIECFVTYVETLGCVQFTYYSEKDDKVEAVYALKGKEYDPKNCEVPALLAIEKSLQEAIVFYENEANKVLEYFKKLKIGFFGWAIRSPLCLLGCDVDKYSRANTIVELIQNSKLIDPQEFPKECKAYPFINAHIVRERLKNAKPKISHLVDVVKIDERLRLM
jgi:hypothetical protein